MSLLENTFMVDEFRHSTLSKRDFGSVYSLKEVVYYTSFYYFFYFGRSSRSHSSTKQDMME